MKLPLETMSGTIWAGIIIAGILALVVNLIGGGAGVGVAILIVLVLWIIMFGLLIKPTPPRT
jgi:hypothetical protein